MTDDSALGARQELLRRAYAALSRGDLCGFSRVFDPYVVVVNPSLDNPVGRIAAVAPHELLVAAFPDLAVEVEELIDSRTRTACRLQLRGTHAGYFGTWMPTGRRVRLDVCEVHEWCEDLVVTTQRYWNELALLRQVGIVIPVPLAAA